MDRQKRNGFQQITLPKYAIQAGEFSKKSGLGPVFSYRKIGDNRQKNYYWPEIWADKEVVKFLSDAVPHINNMFPSIVSDVLRVSGVNWPIKNLDDLQSFWMVLSVGHFCRAVDDVPDIVKNEDGVYVVNLESTKCPSRCPGLGLISEAPSLSIVKQIINKMIKFGPEIREEM